MLEKMENFFAARLDEYDRHMMSEIEGAKEFYPYTASLLPSQSGARILDLGCGTGLELEAYYRLNGSAFVVGIDLSADMLNALQKKFSDKNIKPVNASYFDVSFDERYYDAAVSVESLHHFPASKKLELYTKLHRALTEKGYFVLTDYFAESQERECLYFSELARLKSEQGLDSNKFYHYDTPLTVEHEIEVLQQAGFADVKIMRNWGATYTLLAKR